jgi:1-acyl-sn-glycerol-3-phosphate acyltransferase
LTAGPDLYGRVAGTRSLSIAGQLARRVISVLARIDVCGVDRIPPSGAVVLAANHTAFMDGIVLFALSPRPVTCLVKREAFVPVVASVLRWAGQVPIDRPRVDPGPVKLSVALLRAGGVLGVFPEGARGDGSVRVAKPGVGYFALRSGATVIPVAVHGSRSLLHRTSWHRPRLRVVFGPPIFTERAPDDAVLAKARFHAEAERIRAELADLVAATG